MGKFDLGQNRTSRLKLRNFGINFSDFINCLVKPSFLTIFVCVLRRRPVKLEVRFCLHWSCVLDYCVVDLDSAERIFDLLRDVEVTCEGKSGIVFVYVYPGLCNSFGPS